ncbi:hypothetical protein B0T17DRAFT_316432 [Bombardia bombarda]|uniref:Uncharacterized protein n=1 Tax=Bombardia bombarda TaxID=252184 RepID=A0AA39WM41_9PEZI|nr:hypothetical protein B0T17DRAFT_316432 [Bombardia bombarda]
MRLKKAPGTPLWTLLSNASAADNGRHRSRLIDPIPSRPSSLLRAGWPEYFRPSCRPTSRTFSGRGRPQDGIPWLVSWPFPCMGDAVPTFLPVSYYSSRHGAGRSPTAATETARQRRTLARFRQCCPEETIMEAGPEVVCREHRGFSSPLTNPKVRLTSNHRRGGQVRIAEDRTGQLHRPISFRTAGRFAHHEQHRVGSVGMARAERLLFLAGRLGGEGARRAGRERFAN